MSTSFNYSSCSSPVKKSLIVEGSLDLCLQTKFRKESFKWGSINLFFLSIFIYDLMHKCPYSFSNWFYVEYFVTIVLVLSLLYNICKYLYSFCAYEPIKGSEDQRILLSFDENDSYFLTNAAQLIEGEKKNDGLSSNSFNQSNISWQSLNNSTNVSLASANGWFRKNSPQNISLTNSSYNTSGIQNRSANNSLTTPYKSFCNINDENELQQYLKEYSIQEENSNRSFDNSNTLGGISNSINTYWNNFKLDDVSGLLKSAVYQLSPTNSSQNKQNPKEDGNLLNLKDLTMNSEILSKYSSLQLSEYVANLRVWMTGTILSRIDGEINKINDALQARGFSEIKIGSVGLERLKKTAENQYVAQHIPMLPLIIPFLEMSTNQEYLVQRIRDLAKGSCMADYRWNSGSSYNGINWDEHLPTDSSILFHLYCTYLDGQLHPLPQPGGRPFYNRYVMVTEKKSEIKSNTKFAILCTNLPKPKFNFISDGKIQSCVYDRNNLFYVIIQFLIYMKTHHDGILEGVNLGRSGINMMCVIGD